MNNFLLIFKNLWLSVRSLESVTLKIYGLLPYPLFVLFNSLHKQFLAS